MPLDDNQKDARLKAMLDRLAPERNFQNIRGTLEAAAGGASQGFALDARTGIGKQEAAFALESLDALTRDQKLDREKRFVLEAIVLPFKRPVVDIYKDAIVRDQLTGTWNKVTAVTDDWVKQRVRAVGRINVPGILYGGTGFVVGKDLLMTNRHVAGIFAQGLGERKLEFQPGQSAAIDFYHEHANADSESLTIKEIVMIHPWWDMALLRVTGLSEDRVPFTVDRTDPSSMHGREIVVIGYPGYDPNGDQEFQNVQSRVFRNIYSVKRFQPGVFRVRRDVESYKKIVSAITHDCSTLGGNSGSAVIDVETGMVVALHFAGEYLVDNYAVSTFDLAQDSRVVDAGVNFGGPTPDPRGDFYGLIWSKLETESPAVQPVQPADVGALPMPSGAAASIESPATPTSLMLSRSLSLVGSDGPSTPVALQVTIALRITVDNETPTQIPSRVKADASPASSEGLLQQAQLESGIIGSFSQSPLHEASFSWKAALSLGLAARLSYSNSSQVLAMTRAWGFTSCEFLDRDDTQCFVAQSDRAVVLAFRGSESFRDWIGNLNVFYTSRNYGKVHRGFLAAFQVVDQPLRSLLSGLNGRELFLTGHSLGGALATVAAAEWQGAVPISWVYTFGQPTVGRSGFAEFIARNYGDRFIRVVNDDDVVPKVPPGYDHVGRLYHFDAAGGLQRQLEGAVSANIARIAPELAPQPGPPMLSEAEFDQLRARLLLSRNQRGVESPVPEGLLPSFRDHAIDRYLERITARAAA